MKKKMIAGLIASVCMVSVVLPASAATSYLNVSKGDEYSLWTYKDSGSQWDNYFYITPTSYGGASTIYGRSYAQDGLATSAYHAMSRSSKKYSYGATALGGKNYRLQTYASPDSYAWNLVGRYTP